MAKVAVIGAGAWGTALACHAARREHAVTLWAHEPEVVDEVNTRHLNSLYLQGVDLSPAIRAVGDPAEAAQGAEVVVLVPPSAHLRAVSRRVAPAVGRDTAVVVATKGIEEQTLKLMPEVLGETMPGVGDDRLAFLSGPSFAREVAQGLPTDVALASRGMAAARRLQAILHAPLFRVYASADPVGLQVGGAIKNVMAVATGASDGLGLGHNARAGLITRGLAEMTRLGVVLGADPLTFLGLAGVGDLVLTCTGDLSRNRTLGKQIAAGVDPQRYLAAQRAVAEGFLTSAAAYGLGQRHGVDMPITEQVYHVLHRGRPLHEAVQTLMNREFTDELRGIRDA